MSIIRENLEPGLPNNLAEALSPGVLMRIVFEAIDATQWPRPMIPEAGTTPEPVMRTVTAYCYGMGAYGSAEIEALCRNDEHVRYLCAGDLPTFKEIRNFRRNNITNLRETVARMLHAVWEHMNAEGASFLPFVIEADARIAMAVEADSAAMDY